MTRELQITADGSHTVAVPELHSTYHSTFGAIQESRHVFIEAGLSYVLQNHVVTEQSRAATEQSFFSTKSNCIRIFEMGFGTGLNALLSFQQIKKENKHLYYAATELYPLSWDEAAQLNYISQLGDETLAPFFSLLHTSPWQEDVAIAPFFTLYKIKMSLLEIEKTQPFHLIYFDAFAPDVQPELWTEDVFAAMYNMLYKEGVLVTYCAKGSVRRILQSVGFVVEKLAGAPGKKEMIRAVKRVK